MKRLIFTLFFFSAVLSAHTQNIEVPATQKSLITKRTADWCPLCGGWGWPFFRQLILDNSDKAVLIAAHYSGGLINPTAIAITSNLGGVSQPRYYFNNQDQNASSTNTATVRTTIQGLVDDAFNQPPVAQTGLLVAAQDGELTVLTKTRFFQDAEGDYYLGVYLIETNYIGYQAGQGENAEHKQLLRAHLTAQPFGESLGSGTVDAGTEVSIDLAFNLGNYDRENIEIASIIWKKNGDKYDVVNCNSTTEILDEIVAAKDLEVTEQSFSIFPNITSQAAVAAFELPQSSQQVELAIFDLQGRMVKTVFRGQLSEGRHQFDIQRPANAASGVYLVRLMVDGKAFGRRMVVR
jgi:hypothetical protein